MAVGGRKKDTTVANPVGHSVLTDLTDRRLPGGVAADEPPYPTTRRYMLRVVLANARGAASRTEHGSAADPILTITRTAPG